MNHKNINPDEFTLSAFIIPLQGLGFKFEGYNILETDEGGCYVFLMSGKLTEDNKDEVEEICTQDDDSQPAATYRYYFGSLFVMVPFLP
jgi:hypothetical protein